MLKRGWFQGFKATFAEAKTQKEEFLHAFVGALGALGANASIPTLNRRFIRDTGKRDSPALNAWRIRRAILALNDSMNRQRCAQVHAELLKILR